MRVNPGSRRMISVPSKMGIGVVKERLMSVGNCINRLENARVVEKKKHFAGKVSNRSNEPDTPDCLPRGWMEVIHVVFIEQVFRKSFER